ncbi:LuxR C-terminal-related transcriptional regulator [Ruminococcaceae bacterium OttesenSCG-928-D13]|nr:LuxR C-terminal-related transcriptional regulator [Ruminococcaceae bacterium OttesenSCG-928-D13]
MRRQTLPYSPELPARQRIDSYFEQGLSNSLITVSAAPGYGKTHETARWLSSANVRLAWMRLTRLDNLPLRFWSNLVESFRMEFPDMADKLEEMGFPDSLAKMDAFVRILADEVYSGALAVLAIDDCNTLESPEIEQLFEFLLEAEMENFCIVRISRTEMRLYEKNLYGGGISRITQDMLAFTLDELRDYCTALQLGLSEQTVVRLHEDTGGWPLMIHLLVNQIRTEHTYRKSLDSSQKQISSLFEKGQFSAYSLDVQKFLVRLSLTPIFSLDMIRQLAGPGMDEFVQVLIRNPYVAYEPSTGLYTFQNMYRDFLISKQDMIAPKERERTFRAAGDSALAYGHLLDATDYYSRCGRFEDMVGVIVKYIAGQFAVSLPQCEFFLDKLNHLPTEFSAGHDLVDYCKACIYIQLLQPDRAMETLEAMAARLEDSADPKAKSMLGEVYERMAGVYMIWTRECFMDYYKKAAKLLPSGSAFKPKGMLRFKNYNIISVEENVPEALQRMETKIHEGISAMVQVEGGAAAGFQYLFSTEAAYNTLNLDRAKQMAHRAIYDAVTADQHDIVCSAYYMLAKAYCMEGDQLGMREQIAHLCSYADGLRLQEINEIRDYALSWYRFVLGDVEQITPWIVSAQRGIASLMPLAIGRAETLFADYLYSGERYNEMIALLEHARNLYRMKGWGDLVNTHLLLALGYHSLGDGANAMQSLLDAYSMTWQNQILAPFVERGEDIRVLLRYAVKQDCPLDKAWVETVSDKAQAYSKALAQMKKQYKSDSKSEKIAQENPLTKRETVILAYLAQGMMREEISAVEYVSINTVKSHIRSIYNKLGAINRADAVRIGIQLGIIEPDQGDTMT